MCTVPLPPGVYPIAVDKYIISKQMELLFTVILCIVMDWHWNT